jgi:thioredoxin 1
LKSKRATNRYRVILVVLTLFLFLLTGCKASTSQSTTVQLSPLEKALSNGKPTLAEFGRGTCIPCKEMKPILDTLAVEYKDRLSVEIVSVDLYRSITNKYGIIAIPTQIFFDSSGKEVMRHVGFFPREDIITQLNKMGIE